ncbi:MAG: hypothetical protein IT273_14605 [Chitinophagales bacterium]|nr:hypothetical protein [Chitinophagales bacterium]
MLGTTKTSAILFGILFVVLGILWWYFSKKGAKDSPIWGQVGIDSNNDGFIEILQPIDLTLFANKLYTAISSTGYAGLNPLLNNIVMMTPESLLKLNTIWLNEYANRGIAGTNILAIGSLPDALSNEYCGLFSELDCNLLQEAINKLQNL